MNDYLQYRIAVATNLAAIMNFLSSWDLNHLKSVTYWDGSKPNLSLNILSSKIYDIIACTCIGALPKSDSSGADGILWRSADSIPEEIETKLCGTHRDDIALGMKDTLYCSTNLDNHKSKTLLASKLAGSFHAAMSEKTLKTKARPTYLVVLDWSTNQCVGAWMLDPLTTMEQLKKRMSKQNKTLTLKLQVFLNHGTTVETVIPSIGYDAWYDELVEYATARNRYILSPARIKKNSKRALTQEEDCAIM